MVNRMKKLAGLHPVLVDKITKVIHTMESLGFYMMVTDGIRTAEQQNALYQQGRSKPGKIVTNCDGIRNKSNHQLKADGFGHAVDCCFVVDGKPSWDSKLPWNLYGEMVKSQNLSWGGSFKSLVGGDSPHAELTNDGKE